MLTLAVLVLPAVGALVLALLPRRLDRTARWLAVVCTAATFVVSCALLPGLASPTRGVVDPRHTIDAAWIPALDVRFHIGVDGVSVPLVVLTALLTFLCAVYTVVALPRPGRAAEFLALVLLTEVGMLGTFVALDLLVFFLFFEVVLVPMYFLVAVWGGGRGRHAATKFVLYTLLGSVFVLVGILTVYANTGTLDVVALSQQAGGGMGHATQVLAFLALFVGFAVKSPLYPLHTWLPDAHTEAPTVGSVLLAGVLLKMGTYGLVRVALPVVPDGARTLAPGLGVLAVAGIVAGALCCLVQRDLKRLIAYSSVGHMGFVLLGIATLTPVGVNAALLANVAHGVITGLLFFLVGAVKDRYQTGDLAALGNGLASRLPRLGALFVLACVASLGLPGLAGFWGEALSLFASYRPAPALSQGLFTVLLGVASVGTAVTAAYFLRLLRGFVLGADTHRAGGAEPGPHTSPEPALHAAMAAPDVPAGGAPAATRAVPAATPAASAVSPGTPSATAVPKPPDLRRYEIAAWAPLAVLTVAIGVYPRLVLGLTDEPVRALLGVFVR